MDLTGLDDGTLKPLNKELGNILGVYSKEMIAEIKKEFEDITKSVEVLIHVLESSQLANNTQLGSRHRGPDTERPRRP